MSLWICGICKRTLDEGEDPVAHLEVCKPKRIAELEAENKRLREALEVIVDSNWSKVPSRLIAIAKQALGDKEPSKKNKYLKWML